MAQVIETAPTSVLYGDQLPLAIQAKSQRKLFFPTTGGNYSGSGNNICRIDLAYDGMIDTSQSYLQFDVTNAATNAAPAAAGFTPDLGQPFINRLRVECGGVVLEDIQNYNTLLAGILTPSQNGSGNNHMDAFNLSLNSSHSQSPNAAVLAGCTYAPGSVSRAVAPIHCIDANARDISNGFNVMEHGATFTMNYKLISGLLDNDKYLPLALLNAPLTIELTFETAANAGCGEAAVVPKELAYSNVRYVAHTIDLTNDFYNRLRAQVMNSAGGMMIAGTSFRNYQSVIANTTQNSVNIPARLRSIKSIFFKIADANDTAHYGLSMGGHANITGYQLKVGGNLYPPTPVKIANTSNKGAAYLELQKAFGKLGSTIHSDMLTPDTYLIDVDGNTAFSSNAAVAGSISSLPIAFAPYGLDLEAFRHEIENGIDSASKALPISLELTHSGAAGALPIQIFVMYDSLFYIRADGSIAVST